MLIDLVVADTVIRDQISQKWSFVGICEQMYAQNFPAGMMTFATLARIANPPAKGQYSLSIIAPGGAVISSGSMLFENGAGKKDCYFSIGFGLQQVIFQKPGRYTVSASLDGETIGERAFWAKKIGLEEVSE